MSKALLHIEGLGMSYHKLLFQHFNLQAQAGELIALTGRNGVGKTTLLKIIAGLQKPDSGRIEIQSRLQENWSSEEKARLVALVLTRRVVLGGVDVETLVSMGRYPHLGRFSFGRVDDEIIARTCLQRLQIEHLAKQPVDSLSDGEFQKAMIARALAQQTPIILLDEPTAFLDYVAKEELMEILKSLALDGKLILFTSHDLDLVKRYAHRRIEISS